VQRFEQNGLAIELTVVPQDGPSETGAELTAGQTATVKVALMDAKSGSPVVGIRPKGWMVGRPSEMAADEHSCVEKIRRLAGGRLGARAEVDLNRYVIVTMNHDKTVSVIDPQVEFGATKLESLVTLPGNGADWVLSPDQSYLYVTIPGEDAVAVIEMIAGKYAHVDYDLVPSVVYTAPEVAWVGKTEEQLKEAGVAYKAGKFPFTANSRAKINHETDGFVKVLADAKTDEILGVHMIGPQVGEMIGEYCVAMAFKAASEDVARVCHPHPTRSEAGRQAAMGVEGWTMQA